MTKKLEGLLYGPSHKRGGIKFNVGGEVQEAEGGEYIIKKSSVNKETEPILEKINKTGKLTYRCGGKIPVHDAEKEKSRR